MPTAGNDLGVFLRARRRALPAPDEPGTGGPRRRGPGLRRDEVAADAGISPIYYARLEQGAKRNPSATVIAALSRALRLTEPQAAHLARLAGLTPDARRERPWIGPDAAGALSDVLDELRGVPAYVVGPGGRVIMSNPLAQVICPAYIPGTIAMKWLFTAPEAKLIVANWDRIACETVARLRHDTEQAGPARSELHDLVATLHGDSEEFGRLWQRYDVSQAWRGPITYRHAEFGDLTFERLSLLVAGTPSFALHVLQPRDADCRTAMAALATLT